MLFKGIRDQKDEVGELARALENMTADLNDRGKLIGFQSFALNSIALMSETDPYGKITFANEKFCKISGYSETEIVGKDHRLIKSNKHSKDFFKQLWETISKGEVWSGEICNRNKSGDLYWVDTFIIPIKDNENRILKFVSFRIDITKRKEQELELVEKNKMKQKFFANMNHEIRTPIGVVIGLVELLLSTELSNLQKKKLKTIKETSEHLLQIVNDILDVSKFESGKVDLEPVPTDVKELTLSIVDLLKRKSEEKELVLSSRVPQDEKLFVLIDPTKMKQVIINIINNAIKFTSHGGVKVVLKKNIISSEKVLLTWTIIDTGVGISKSNLKKIFQEFEQVKGGLESEGGTGLGLSISKQIVKAMNGNIWVESELGRGSQFFIEIPCEIMNPENIFDKQVKELQKSDIAKFNGQVLVVDDYHLNREIVSQMINELGIQLDVAKDGFEAVAMWEKKNYRVIFLDIKMPRKNGIEACLEIRKLEQKLKREPSWIVALTANVFKEDRDKYTEVGFDDFLPKPVTKGALEQALINVGSSNRKLSSALVRIADFQKVSNLSIDWEYIISIIGRNTQKAEKILDQLLFDVNNELNRIEAFYSKNEYKEMIDSAHAGKGNCANFGLFKASNIFAQIESEVGYRNYDKLPSLIDGLKKEIAQVTKELRGFQSSRVS